MYMVPTRPRMAFGNTRVNTLGSLLIGFGQTVPVTPLEAGHDQELFNPAHSVASLQNGVTIEIPTNYVHHHGRGQRVVQQHQQAGPSPMLNGNNSCFAAAAFVFLYRIEVILIKMAQQ